MRLLWEQEVAGSNPAIPTISTQKVNQMLKQEYVYNAKIVNVVDGDTVDMIVDLGFNVFKKDRFRLSRIDTPELNSKIEDERVLAKEAKAFMLNYLNKDVVIESFKKDKYGRYLAEIYTEACTSINQLLVDNGLAKIYGS